MTRRKPVRSARRAARVEIVCSGSELLKDKINSNIITIAEHLEKIGLGVTRAATVADDARELAGALKEALRRSDVVIASGGLGPTFDDLTRDCAAKVLKRPLLFSPPLLRGIQARFDSIGLRMPEENRLQAYLVRGARPIANEVGTAPGQIIDAGGKTLVLLPGPPEELIPMMRKAVCPYLRKKHGGLFRRSLLLHVFGHPESEIDQRIKPVTERIWDKKGARAAFGILAGHSVIDVKAAVKGESKAAVDSLYTELRGAFRRILGEDIYGEGGDTLQSVVGGLLRRRKETLVLAESCTGGLIADRITEVPGSSLYFLEGTVAYSDESKVRRLGVNPKTIRKFGAVSEETAREMARGALKESGANWAVSVTGIAGPSGKRPGKPVGLVYFAVADKREVTVARKNFKGTRSQVKERAALWALDLLRRRLCRPVLKSRCDIRTGRRLLAK